MHNGLIEFGVSQIKDFQFVWALFHSFNWSIGNLLPIGFTYVRIVEIFANRLTHSMQLCVKYFLLKSSQHSYDGYNYMCRSFKFLWSSELWLSTYNLEMASGCEIHKSYSILNVRSVHDDGDKIHLHSTTKRSLSSNIFCLNWKPSSYSFA